MRRIGLAVLIASVLFVPLLISAGNPLLQRIEALEAELNKQPVVIDANGAEVGTVVGAEESHVSILFDFEKVPLFVLHLRNGDPETLWPETGSLLFESVDCSGDALVGSDSPRLFAWVQRNSSITFVSPGRRYLAAR